MQDRARQEPELAAQLIEKIVTKANGVFLWVTLAVESLLKGLRNRDDISDLQDRLQALPAELEGMYTLMLNQIEPFYRAQALRTFLIFNAMLMVMGDVCSLELDAAVTASFENTLEPRSQLLKDINVLRIQYRLERIEAHLKTRCAGLLEVFKSTGPIPRLLSHGPSRDEAVDGYKVRYLHQTVPEYLNKGSYGPLLLQAEPIDHSFNPNLQILMSFVVRMKQNFLRAMKSPAFPKGENIHLAMRFAQKCEEGGEVGLVPILDELNGVYNGRDRNWSDWSKDPEQRGTGLVGEAISYGLLSYVASKLATDYHGLIQSERANQALLNCALLPKL